MKKIIFILAFLFIAPTLAISTERVKGHWKDANHDGVKDTYIKPYQRTSPNNTRTDNYNYPGNYNPNTGRITPGKPPTDKNNNHPAIKVHKIKTNP
jgi:hypothetical protein